MHQIFRPATLTISVKIILRARNTGAGFDVPEMTSRMWQNKNHSSCAANEREIKSIMGIRVNPAIKFMMSPWGTCWACPACHIKKDCQSVKFSSDTWEAVFVQHSSHELPVPTQSRKPKMSGNKASEELCNAPVHSPLHL